MSVPEPQAMQPVIGMVNTRFVVGPYNGPWPDAVEKVGEQLIGVALWDNLDVLFSVDRDGVQFTVYRHGEVGEGQRAELAHAHFDPLDQKVHVRRGYERRNHLVLESEA